MDKTGSDAVADANSAGEQKGRVVLGVLAQRVDASSDNGARWKTREITGNERREVGIVVGHAVGASEHDTRTQFRHPRARRRFRISAGADGISLDLVAACPRFFDIAVSGHFERVIDHSASRCGRKSLHSVIAI